MEELLKVLADPICSQIVQILRVRGKMTIAEIIAVSPKLSRATVYRRMEKMLQTGAVRIAETRKVRIPTMSGRSGSAHWGRRTTAADL